MATMHQRRARLSIDVSREARRRIHIAAAKRDKSIRSEEHTSELQSQSNLVCRLLLEKKNTRLPSEIMQRQAPRDGSITLGSFAAMMIGAGLDDLFSPRSFAVVGASRNPVKIRYDSLR